MIFRNRDTANGMPLQRSTVKPVDKDVIEHLYKMEKC